MAFYILEHLFVKCLIFLFAYFIINKNQKLVAILNGVWIKAGVFYVCVYLWTDCGEGAGEFDRGSESDRL